MCQGFSHFLMFFASLCIGQISTPYERTGEPPFADCRSIQILREEVDSLCDRFTANVALFERLCTRLTSHVTA